MRHFLSMCLAIVSLPALFSMCGSGYQRGYVGGYTSKVGYATGGGNPRYNLISQSEDFSNDVAWDFAGVVTDPDSVIVAPQRYAQRWMAEAGETPHYIVGLTASIPSFKIPADAVLSCYFRKDAAGIVMLGLRAGTGTAQTTTWTTDGTTFSHTTSMAGITGHGETNVGGGWWRLWVHVNAAAEGLTAGTSYLRPYIYLNTTAESPGYGAYVWGAQYETLVSSPRAYQRTGNSIPALYQTDPYLRIVAENPLDYWWRKSWQNNVVIGGVNYANTSQGVMTVFEDPDHGAQWPLGEDYLNMPRAWAVSKGTDVAICISDQEIDMLHPDLSPKLLTNSAESSGTGSVDDDGNGLVDDLTLGWNFMDGVNSTTSTFGEPLQHGTGMASILGAATNNDTWMLTSDPDGDPGRIAGIAGIAWESPIVPLKVFSSIESVGSPFSDFVPEYIIEYNRTQEGLNKPIRVASMSWMGQTEYLAFRLNEAGVLGVCGAGNANNWESINPAHVYPGLLVVGAVNKNGARIDYENGSDGGSCFGAGVDLVAYSGKGQETYADKGGGWNDGLRYESSTKVNADFMVSGYTDMISSTALNGAVIFGYNFYNRTLGQRARGVFTQAAFTSGATAMVAGVAALIYDQNPTYTIQQARSALFRGCVNIDVENPALVDSLGAGRLDAYRALTLWGKMGNTTLSGDVYISGDVWIPAGVTVACEAGTVIHVSPDDNYENDIIVGPTSGDVNCPPEYAIDYSGLTNNPPFMFYPVPEIYVDGQFDAALATFTMWESAAGSDTISVYVQAGGEYIAPE